MRILVIPRNVHRDIERVVRAAPDGLETGVTLFGIALTDVPAFANAPQTHAHFVVLAVAGPGRRAVHEPAHYAVDDDHASSIFRALGSALPGIAWLGELHLHPPGMSSLSSGDHRTIRAILAGGDGNAPPDEIVAGVMQRRAKAIDLYPLHFTTRYPKGEPMAVYVASSESLIVQEARLMALRTPKPRLSQQGARHHETRTVIANANEATPRPDLRTEPGASGASPHETCRFGWLRQWWWRFGRHGRARRGEPLHAG